MYYGGVQALADFMLRVQEYEKRYHSIEDDEDSGNIRCLHSWELLYVLLYMHAEYRSMILCW